MTRSKRPVKRNLTSETLGFLQGVNAQSTDASLDSNNSGGIDFLSGLGVVDGVRNVKSSDFNIPAYVSRISNTERMPLSSTVTDPYVRKQYGASKQLTVPSVLCAHAIFRSWSDAIPFVIPSSPLPDSPPFWYHKQGGINIASTTPSGAIFASKPNLADYSAYVKAINAVRAGTYSQSVRMNQFPVLAGPLWTEPNPALPLFIGYPWGLIAKGDTIAFDPRGTSAIAPQMARRFQRGGSTLFGWNGWDLNSAGSPTAFMHGSAYAFEQFMNIINYNGDGQDVDVLEFLRQLACSPLIRAYAIPRPADH